MRRRVDTWTWGGEKKAPKRTMSILFQPDDLERIKAVGLGCGPFLREKARDIQGAIKKPERLLAFRDLVRVYNANRWKGNRPKGRIKTISATKEAQMMIADIAEKCSVTPSEVVRTILLVEVARLEKERKEQMNG
jgi:hypothetical protein